MARTAFIIASRKVRWNAMLRSALLGFSGAARACDFRERR